MALYLLCHVATAVVLRRYDLDESFGKKCADHVLSTGAPIDPIATATQLLKCWGFSEYALVPDHVVKNLLL